MTLFIEGFYKSNVLHGVKKVDFGCFKAQNHSVKRVNFKKKKFFEAELQRNGGERGAKEQDGGGGGGVERERRMVSLESENERVREKIWRERESCMLTGRREVEAGGKKSGGSAGLERPMPWTGGALLANIQPSPCSTTTSTHRAPNTGRARPAASSPHTVW